MQPKAILVIAILVSFLSVLLSTFLSRSKFGPVGNQIDPDSPYPDSERVESRNKSLPQEITEHIAGASNPAISAEENRGRDSAMEQGTPFDQDADFLGYSFNSGKVGILPSRSAVSSSSPESASYLGDSSSSTVIITDHTEAIVLDHIPNASGFGTTQPERNLGSDTNSDIRHDPSDKADFTGYAE